MYSRDELSQFTLQKLASIYPQSLQEEEVLKEIFEMRASVSNYFALTSLIDIKHGWQEAIIQKYVDIKRENMPPENPVSLTPEDEAKLDANVVTKEIETELQTKLDTHNAKRKGIVSKETVVPVETEAEKTEEVPPAEVPVVEPPVITEPIVEKKRGRPKKV